MMQTKSTPYEEVLDFQALQDIALGATFLGAGGGGDPYATLLQLSSLVKIAGPITLMSPDALADDDIVAPCGWLGAPGIQKEKYASGLEGAQGIERLEEILGKPIKAIMPIEIGGGNGVTPFVISAITGIPVLDCDAMGRAFPQANMVTFNIYDCSASPAVITDVHGNSVVLDTVDNSTLERVVRSIAVSMGGYCHLIDYPLEAKKVRSFAVLGTVSLARSLGRQIRQAREAQLNPVEALLAQLGATRDYKYAYELFDGKIVDVERDFQGGFLVGTVKLEAAETGATCSIKFQNEYIFASLGDRVVASVPDIIAIVDRETASPINTENLKYGQRVKVLACSVSDLLRSEKALELLGPKAFGLPFEYAPVEQLNKRERLHGLLGREASNQGGEQ